MSWRLRIRGHTPKVGKLPSFLFELLLLKNKGLTNLIKCGMYYKGSDKQ